MPNIATVLKQEITRLARKEAKSQTEVMRRAVAQYRRDIAELKREVQRLTKQTRYLGQQENRRAQQTTSSKAPAGQRFSARGLRTHREKLGFSAAEYADLVGVSAQTIYNWEQGKSRPRDQQFAALVEVRALGKRAAEQKLELMD